ncbi:MAG: SulP family inorganic anion transporter [Flavobacteriaceae bacterium]|nr:SulP family inorganic anion transporter [Flavobacteriaceae bacterium]
MTHFFTNLKGNLFGGITAAIVALPLALAFGVQSGMGAAAGLYGAIFIGVFAALFGGTKTQISGPTAPMTVITTVLFASVLQDVGGSFEKALPIVLVIFLLAGLFQILLGVLRIGTYVKYIPYPVVSGFMTGIGVIILITQIFPLFGYTPANDAELLNKYKPLAEERLLEGILKEEVAEDLLVLEDFQETIKRSQNITPQEIEQETKSLVSAETKGVIGSIRFVPNALSNIIWLEFLFVLATIIIIYGFKRITTAVPSSLVALVVLTLLAQLGGIDVFTIADKSPIPSGFPTFNYQIFTDFSLADTLPYIGASLTLAGLGAIDSLLTSIVADNMTKTKHNSNKELIGQGIGNSVAAIFGGIPGAGATIRTVINIKSGGTTQLSGVVHGVILLLILLALGPIASTIPLSVLAGILITVGIGVMDYRGLKALFKMPRPDAVVLLVVLIFTVFFDLITAVVIGLVLSSVLFMKKMGDTNMAFSRVTPLADLEETPWSDESRIDLEIAKRVYVKHLDGPLFFGFTSDFQSLSTKIPPETEYVIIRMEKVPFVDQSGLYAFEEVLLSLAKTDIKVCLTGLKEQPAARFKTIDIIPDLVPHEQVFANFHDCINYINNTLKH